MEKRAEIGPALAHAARKSQGQGSSPDSGRGWLGSNSEVLTSTPNATAGFENMSGTVRVVGAAHTFVNSFLLSIREHLLLAVLSLASHVWPHLLFQTESCCPKSPGW